MKVMISYSIEATLILIYVLAYYLCKPSPQGTSTSTARPHRFNLLPRLHTATVSSIHSLYVTATTLSYAIVTAAIFIFSQNRLAASLVDIYMNELLVLAPTFSIFPVLVLHTLLPDWKAKSMTSHQGKEGWEGRNGFRRLLGVVLYMFCLVTVWVVFVKGIRSTDPDFELGGEHNIRLSHDVYLTAPKYIKGLVIVMLVVPLLGLAALGGVRWLRRRASRPRPPPPPPPPSNRRQPPNTAHAAKQVWTFPRAKVLASVAIQALSIAMMLINLTWLWYLRTEAMHHAGGIDRDTEWNFGQILAAATWLPVLMEFVYFFFFANHLSNSNVGASIPLATGRP